MYNYFEEMKEDVKDFMQYVNFEDYSTREELEEELNEYLWIYDSVTGNASGSYTFNTWTAKKYVLDNEDLCREALEEFCTSPDTIAEKFLEGDWEWFDVTIRCYLLRHVVSEVLDEYELADIA